MAGPESIEARLVALPAFVVPPAVRQTMVDHARREHPRECCGLLVGRGRVVMRAVATRNMETSATRFRVDDREHLALRRALRLISPPLHIIGMYHSHPMGPARPSLSDLAEAFYPDWLYVVAGLVGPRVRVRGFVLETGRMRPVRLRMASAAP